MSTDTKFLVFLCQEIFPVVGQAHLPFCKLCPRVLTLKSIVMLHFNVREFNY